MSKDELPLPTFKLTNLNKLFKNVYGNEPDAEYCLSYVTSRRDHRYKLDEDDLECMADQYWADRTMDNPSFTASFYTSVNRIITAWSLARAQDGPIS